MAIQDAAFSAAQFCSFTIRCIQCDSYTLVLLTWSTCFQYDVDNDARKTNN